MDSGEEEYQWLPERRLQEKSRYYLQWFLGTTSSLWVNHHHIPAKEHPIQYTSDCIALYYIQNTNFLLHLINTYSIPKT